MLKQIKVTKYTSGEISVHLSWIRQILPRHREAITKKEGKKPDKNRIIYSWEAVYFQCDRMFRDRPTVETGEIHQFFFWIRRRWNPCRGNVLFFFFYLIVIQYEVVNIWNRSSIEISRFFANFHSRVSLFVFIRVHLSSIYILVLIRSLLPIMYEKGFRKSYIASETSINMTNGRNLFTNYFLRVVQYLFQSV